METISMFTLDGKVLETLFIETLEAFYPGVTCHTYIFPGDPNMDLAIVEVEPGGKTPAQKVLEGERTVQQYVSGKGTLYVVRSDGKREEYVAAEGLIVEVSIGDKMQWKAADDSNLVFAEVCQPAYKDGRYENLDEDLF